MTWGEFWLILHILAAIAGFGVTFGFGIIAARGAREPRQSLFATEVIETLSTRLTLPLALVVGITGVLLMISFDIELAGSEWLWISIITYVLAYAFALFVQRPTTHQMIRVMKELQGTPPPAEAAGPPPQLAGLIKRSQIGGIVLTLSLVALVVLMIWQPGAPVAEH